LRKQRSRLRSTLESYLRGRDTSRYLQDQIVTDRNGRYVLVVRAEHRASIPGIIHGSSASGASLYLEPLSTVEVNNEIVALEEQEAAEIRRILLLLTDAFRRRALELKRTLESATELDVVQAKARFSSLVGGVEPVLSTDTAVELRSARHPLLIRVVTERLADVEAAEGDEGEPREKRERRNRPAEPVPVDVLLAPPSTVLVITGPNTGGKTVALKTMGLLALMAQAGLHIPAAPGSRLPVFRSIFADIGDEQSIAADLSTFSWHVTNLVSMERSLTLPALVLFDEIGSGTDPAEGGALATAVVDQFRARGAVVLCTTHTETLKTYATTTPGVTVAAFGFDPATFEPTYRLIYGSPGRSLALEIAARLGLSAEVIAKARQNLGTRDVVLNEHLAKIDENLHELEHERRLVARERQVLGEAEVKMRGREEALRQREEAFRRKTEEKFDARMREARLEIDKAIDELKRKTAALAAEAERRLLKRGPGAPLVSTGDAGQARADARQALDEAAARFRGTDQERREPPATIEGRPTPGDRVAVAGLGLEGVFASAHGDEAEVDIHGKRLRARLSDLRLIAKAGTAQKRQPERVNVNINVQSREGSPSDLNVIGCTVEEAIGRAERFLDQVLLNDQRTIRVIHGHGTGQLRRALGEFLRNHPLVARCESAPPEQGGSGVTLVELKD
jgi:DNA mismatch repair protein MutS2